LCNPRRGTIVKKSNSSSTKPLQRRLNWGDPSLMHDQFARGDFTMKSSIRPSLLTVCLLSVTAFAGEAPPPIFNPPSAGTPFPVADRFIKRIEVADVNGDGLLDVVASDNVDVPNFQHHFHVFLNNGDGTFASPVFTMVATEGNDLFDAALTLGDLNEDGRADLVTTRLSKTTPPMGNRPNIAILFGASDGHFINQVDIANSSTDVFMRTQTGRAIALADMNADGHLDIVSAASNSAAGNMSVLLGNGDGTLQLPIQSGNGGPHGLTMTGDVDGDGDLDVVTATDIGSNDHARTAFHVNLNDGAGHLTNVNGFDLFVQENSIDTESRLWLNDLDGDGLADLTYQGDRGQQTGSGGLYVRHGAGDGTFATVLFYRAFGSGGDSTFTVLNADFDGDGDVDIAKIPNPGAPGEVLVNNGEGQFTSAPIAATATDAVCAFGDLADSPLPDIAYYDDSYTDPRIKLAVNITPSGAIAGDVTGDGSVNVDDLLAVINGWGPCPKTPPCVADLTDDGEVNVDDLLLVINNWN
jgi:hypothetical protein